MSVQERYDPGEIANGLARHAEAFCLRYFPDGRKVGNYWQMADVSGAQGRSLMIRLQSHGGKKGGKWTDNATGQHGDLLDLLEYRLAPITWPDLLQEAANYVGTSPRPRDRDGQAVQTYRASKRQSEAGKRLFSYGRPLIETPAEHYLRSRDIARFGPALKYHPNVYLRGDDGMRLEIPALLAAITDNAGQLTGCSRTFLDVGKAGLSGIEAPKRVLGRLYGNAIRFGHVNRCTDLLAGEGLETVLSVGTALPQAALAACLTANHLSVFDYPSSIKRLWIVRDNDKAGERAAASLADRAGSDGMQPFVLTSLRGDFNTDLREDGVSVLRQRLAALITAEVSEHDLWP